MSDLLKFNDKEYSIETVTLEHTTITYRAFEHIQYITNPVAPDMQILSIYVPEIYYEGKQIGDYGMKNAPIFMPNTVGGYKPGPVNRPGKDSKGRTNASFYALAHGYVVVSPGIRGRGMQNSNGEFIGYAPAAICDMKAAVRYLRHNTGVIPGDVEKIITNGTSAGGAISSIMGATGNHPDYEAFLKDMGAAEERDDIFAASCYCPITNLDHADMAYEWEFQGVNDFYSMKTQIRWSKELAEEFPKYVNSLGLKDEQGHPIKLDDRGNGSLKDYIISIVEASAKEELEERKSKIRVSRVFPNTEDVTRHFSVIRPEDCSFLSITNYENEPEVKVTNFLEYIKFRTRKKQTPAFDSVAMETPENELFGTANIKCRHFTDFSRNNREVYGEEANMQQIKMMNPMYYIRDDKATKARYYRIRHGALDSDTSLSISAMLHLMLMEQGIKTDFGYPWGIMHAGDYDLEELFAWIDTICK